MNQLEKSASNWSIQTKTRFTLKMLGVIAVCLVLSSPAWIFQASGATASTIQTIDASPKVGSHVSMDLDSQGNPGISYYDFNNTNLKYAYRTGTNWDVQTVDAHGFTGLHTSVAFDSKDHPHISYYGENGCLKYAVWNGTAWSIQKVDVAGSFTSIAIDANDYPHISYFSIQNGSDLKYAAWNGTSWNLQTLDSEGGTGEFTSLKLDNNSYAHISYFDYTNRSLRVAWQNSIGWQTETVDSTVDVGKFSSLDIDANCTTHIAYCDNASRDLRYAVSNESGWNIQVVDSIGDVGTDSSLALDSQGYPHISYTDNTNHVLKYASWNGSDWNIQSLAYAGYVGEYTSLPNDQTAIKIDRDDDACISYCDWGNYCLKYLTLANSTGYATNYAQPSASLTVTPNPVEIGKTVSINITLTPKPPMTTDYYQNITLNITNPDGTSTTLGPFFSNNGTVFTPYVPTQIGHYSLQAKYGGQLFLRMFPINDITYFSTQSNVVVLMVQQEPAATPSPSPITTPAPASNQTTKTTYTQSNQQTSSSEANWQYNQQYTQDTNQYGGASDTGYQPPKVHQIPGPFPVVETATASLVAFGICMGILLFLKRWE
jgi:hypothetical protein